MSIDEERTVLKFYFSNDGFGWHSEYGNLDAAELSQLLGTIEFCKKKLLEEIEDKSEWDTKPTDMDI